MKTSNTEDFLDMKMVEIKNTSLLLTLKEICRMVERDLRNFGVTRKFQICPELCMPFLPKE